MKDNMYIGFWKPQDEYGRFSNWSPAEFDFEGKHFRNSEQAFMYKKAELFGDTEIMDKILKNSNPMIVKKLGRCVKNFDKAAFDAVKCRFMSDICYAKFSQNPDLKALLLSTGDAILAEASPLDTVWGIGLTADDPAFTDESKWRGEGLLGKVLMEVRERLRGEV